MLHYEKRLWGLGLLFRAQGSPFPRVLPFAVLSVGITLVIHLSDGCKSAVEAAFGHPYPFQVYAFVIGFLVVLRTNHALARFMEARGHAQWMASKWADAVVMLQAFDAVASGRRGIPKSALDPPTEGTETFVSTLVHLVSLMHALALQHLRGDESLGNLIRAPNATHGEDWTGADSDRPAANGDSTAAVGSVAVSVDEICSPSRARYNVRGAHVLHATTEDEHRPRFSVLSVFALTENSETWRECCAALPLAVVGGLDAAERAALERLDVDRPYLVMAWIQALIMRRMDSEEGLRVPAPIVSRVHQVLSDGMLGYNQADKIATTPFPMPYAQMLTACLVVFNVTLPIMVAGNINALWLAVLVNFISTVAYQGLNEVARELEDPFKPTHVNDIGAPQLQAMFNSKIRAGSPGAGALLRRAEEMDDEGIVDEK